LGWGRCAGSQAKNEQKYAAVHAKIVIEKRVFGENFCSVTISVVIVSPDRKPIKIMDLLLFPILR
jgi:hypothetical protein